VGPNRGLPVLCLTAGMDAPDRAAEESRDSVADQDDCDVHAMKEVRRVAFRIWRGLLDGADPRIRDSLADDARGAVRGIAVSIVRPTELPPKAVDARTTRDEPAPG
jgi:hypothetical protein